MISTDDHPPPDPSSSHHHHQQQETSYDFKISDIDLKYLDADLDDTNNPTPNFSLRDYVSGLRSKDVACNWPFSPESLQLCLKHGVKNLLPPFQSLDLVRNNNNSCFSKCSLENRLPDEKIVSSFIVKPMDIKLKSNEERALGSLTVSTNSSGFKRDNNKSRVHFPEHLAHKRSKVKSSSQKTENTKKSKLVMKFTSSVDQIEEITPNSFIISETVASKVCPVCKIFSSSSNTTLNAHIDQCLTGEGTMKWTENPKVIVKHRVKPRKTRVMVDIYKTAPHCTVEELDRRNGTSWATNSNFPAQEIEFQEEEDKEDEDTEEPIMMLKKPAIADNEGDVYIDTNGTKVRILSVPKTDSLDNHRARKLSKGLKGSKIVIGKKKNNVFKQKHNKKCLKLSPNAKKLCSQVKSGQEEEENRSKVVNERGKGPMKTKVHTKVADVAIKRPPWACSKQTDLAKKFSAKKRKVELEYRATQELLIGSDKTSSGCDFSEFSQSRKRMKTSLPLTEFSKESSEGEDSLHASPQHSDGADFRSKGGNFKYLKKNLSFPASKFNLKRKFIVVEKSPVHSNGNSADEQSQESSQEHSRSEEHTDSQKEDSKSITSKSSNEESTDELQDVEYTKNDMLPNLEKPNFIDLSNAFDPEFSKSEYVELYQDPLICSTNRMPDGKNIFGNEIEDVENHDNYFQEVDPIPIPGPPGSFLPPSPGGETGSEEQLQVDPPFTTTISVPPIENHHHHDQMDRDSMSTSPVSNVSNPSLARSDSRSSEKVSYRSNSVDASYKKPFVNGETSFKNDQPCCCSRKEASGVVKNAVVSNYQDLSVLRKQVVESNVNVGSSGLNLKPNMFSLSNYPNSPTPEKPVFPTIKVPVYDNYDSGASPSKPVLRLMGKNLTVVKTDEEDESALSLQFRQPQSSQRPVIFGQTQNGLESRNFNAYPLNNVNSHVDMRPGYGGFMPPVDRYGHGGTYVGPTVAQSRSHYGHNGLSSSKVVNEIITIDDSPENEGDDSMRNEFLRRNGGQTNSLYTMYQRPYGGGGGDSSVFRGGFQTSLANGDIGKWNIGSSSPSGSTSHLRSTTTYYPPSYP